jgi:hypothetical protein
MSINSTPLVMLPERLRARAAALEGYLAPAERPFLEAAQMVLDALEEFEREMFTIEQASEQSGYSTGHLRRLLGLEEGYDERIPNSGTLDVPRIRRAHLPRKPGHGIALELHTVASVPHRIQRPVASPATPGASLRSQVARAVANGGAR